MSPLLLVFGVLVAHAEGPVEPATTPGSGLWLESAGDLPADTGGARVYLGGRSPFYLGLTGEWFGGFSATAGITRNLSAGVGMTDLGRLALDTGGSTVDPGSLTLHIRYAPVQQTRDFVASITTARPIRHGAEAVAAWQLVGAYGHSFGPVRVYGDAAFVMPERAAMPWGWFGAGARWDLPEAGWGRIYAAGEAWVATDRVAAVSVGVGYVPTPTLSVALEGGPTWGRAPTMGGEGRLTLSVWIDPRHDHQAGDGDADGVPDDRDDCLLVAGNQANGCPARAADKGCDCALDSLNAQDRNALLDLLRHPVDGRLVVVDVWAPPNEVEAAAWRQSEADAAAVDAALKGAGASHHDFGVRAAGPAPDELAPLVTWRILSVEAGEEYLKSGGSPDVEEGR